jgi:hypothetical protein
MGANLESWPHLSLGKLQVPDVASFKPYEKVTVHKKRAFVRPFFSILLI